MNDGKKLPMLDGCDVLPPIETTEAENFTEATTANSRTKPTRKQGRRKTAGRFELLNTFIDCSMAKLCRGDIAVWLVLYRDTRDGTARTSQADIARRSGISDRAVRSALRRLEKKELLDCVYQGGLNRGPSRYRLKPLIEATAEVIAS